MREKVLRFGLERGLSGVLAEPEGIEQVAGAPGVVLLNSGILHHVGPSRLYVRIARLVAVAVAMLFIAGMRYAYFGYVLAIFIPLVALVVMNSAYRMQRIFGFLDPWKDPTGNGLQIIQSWIAIGSGGIFGKGLGEGRQKLFYLPEAHTDFILSVIGEEWGFIGLALIVFCIYLLLRRGMNTALLAPDDFGRYLAFGITFLLAFEAVFNMCVVLGLVPTKGLALPFISYGGSSLICTLAAIGILLNVSSQVQGHGGQP
jgi:cell division protein FtsW